MKVVQFITLPTLVFLFLVSLSCAAQTDASAVSDRGSEPVADRIADRDFPSIFAPWNFGPNAQAKASDPANASSAKETRIATIAHHDLYWNEWASLGLKVPDDQPYVILSPQFTPESIEVALKNRASMRALNPHLLLLANVHYFSVNGASKWAPPQYWIGGNKNNEYKSQKLDFTNPEFQDKIAAFAAALVKSGVFDGIMLDLWNAQWDDKQNAGNELAARLPLIQKMRAAVGEKGLIIVNVNGRLPMPLTTAPYINGLYMEGLGGNFFPDWRTAAANMSWAQTHLHQPVITALEGWYQCGDCQGDPNAIQQQGRADLALMRNITTLSLVFSNGYVLFSDPNPLPTPDHLHEWYPFWDKSLGKAVGPLATLNRPDLSGAYTRQFEKGEAVFNPSNRPVDVNFQEVRRSAATNATGRSFTVAAGDGDLFLKVD